MDMHENRLEGRLKIHKIAPWVILAVYIVEGRHAMLRISLCHQRLINVIGIATGCLTEVWDALNTWAAILTSVLLSRLALDLREASAAGLESEGTVSHAPCDLDFAHEEDVIETSMGEHESMVTESSSFAQNVAPLSTK
ncbi:uncharacterized protein LAESUDRAFT_812362 [Laetiporus sulphureus 93-53]|uniref:Uncharacterized protein n=1 Tax=Laetiporus sulphureus 93-53 TaxID=1314785 RepID=A0A165EGJ2_9APHY|nr:uncharacterized protein LAESUDRAFT_812362 [Laetiporus sulphureus 93-53]KZT07010.1 hypothetical protein LAESUDRAFT_812362 [Laetiporus sulphureus 93-53]